MRRPRRVLLSEATFSPFNVPKEGNERFSGAGERTNYVDSEINDNEGFAVAKDTSIIKLDGTEIEVLEDERIRITRPGLLKRGDEIVGGSPNRTYIGVSFVSPDPDDILGYMPLRDITKPSGKSQGRVAQGKAAQDSITEYIKSLVGEDRFEFISSARPGSTAPDLVVKIDGIQVRFEIKGTGNPKAPITLFDRSLRRKQVFADNDIFSVFARVKSKGETTSFEQLVDDYKELDPEIGYPGDEGVIKSGKLPSEFVITDPTELEQLNQSILDHFAEASHGGDNYFAVYNRTRPNDAPIIYWTENGPNPLDLPPFPGLSMLMIATYGGASSGAMRTGVKIKLKDVPYQEPTPTTEQRKYSLIGYIAEQTADPLFEINMSPGGLKSVVQSIEALAGMEFEMVVPLPDDLKSGPDFDSDERVSSIGNIVDFFDDGDNNGRSAIKKLESELQQALIVWFNEEVVEPEWENKKYELITEYLENEVDPGDLDADVQHAIKEQDSVYQQVHRDFVDSQYEQIGDYESDFLRDQRYRWMKDVFRDYDHIVVWPYVNTVDGEYTYRQIADSFENAIGRRTFGSDQYHSTNERKPNTYYVEPDSSIDADDDDSIGAEIISPPLPLSELVADLYEVYRWAKRVDAKTNKSTGLHISVSVPGFSREKLDYVKLALLVGDQYVLNQFGRAANHYAKSSLQQIKGKLNNPENVAGAMNELKKGLVQAAAKSIHNGQTEKYVSLNVKGGYVEFRSPGGDWLKVDPSVIETTLYRFVIALDAACDPAKYKQEYLKKLYKIMGAQSNNDTIALFAQYSAGELDKQQLTMALKQKRQPQQVTNNGQ